MTRATRRSAPLALIAGLAAGCFVDLGVDDRGSVSCTSPADCPEGWACREAIGRCVPSNNSDTRAPGLRGIPTVTPAVVGLGQTFTVLFGVDEELSEPAVLQLGDASHPLSVASRGPDGSGGENYAFTHVVTESDPSGDVLLTARLVDLWANESRPSVAQITIDFAPPNLDDLDWRLVAGKSAARAPDTLAFSANASGDARVVGARLIDQDGQLLDDLLDTVRLVSTTVTTVIEGEVVIGDAGFAGVAELRVELDVEDEVGNRVPFAQARTPSLVFDTQGPLDGGISLDGGADETLDLGVGVALTVSGAQDVMLLGDVLNDDVTLEWRSLAGLPSPLSVTVTPAPIGDKEVCARFRDGAFNETADLCATIELLVDATPPTVSAYSINTPSPTNSRTVAITLTVNDNRGVDGYAFSETSVAPTPGNFIELPAAVLGATVLDVEYTFSPGDGDRELWAWSRDVGGAVSPAIDTASIFIDTQAPTLGAITITKNVNGAANTNAPVVVFTRDDPGGVAASGVSACHLGTTTTTPDAASITSACTGLSLTLADGTHTLYGWVRDTAGNVSAVASDTVSIDTVRPVITSFFAPRSTYDGTVPILSFSATDTGLGVWRYTTSLDTPCSASTAGYQATPPAESATISSGSHTLYFCVTDRAENLPTSSTTSVVEHGEILVASPADGGRHADIAMVGGGSIFSIAYDQAASPVVNVTEILPGATFDLNPGLYQFNPKIARTSLYTWVAWVQSTGPHAVSLRRETLTGTPGWAPYDFVLAATGVNPSDSSVDITTDGIDAFFAWAHTETITEGSPVAKTSIYVKRQRGQDAYNVYTPSTPLIFNNPTFGHQNRDPEIAPGVVVFEHFDGTNTSIVGARFNADLTLNGSEATISSTTDATNPTVCRGSALIFAWETGGDIWARRYNPGSSGLTGPNTAFRVNDTTTGTQQHPALVCHSTGGFTVVWESPDGSGMGIFARTFNASDAPTSVNDLPINTVTTGEQTDPAISGNAYETHIVWTDNSTGTARIKRRGY